MSLYRATIQASGMLSEVQELLRATTLLTQCPALTDALLLVREWGNLLNGSKAISYHVSALRTLRDVRGREAGLTLLHFLAAVMKKCEPHKAAALVALKT